MLRVGLDLTPLLGPPTGIHQHTKALLEALTMRDDVEVRGWLLTGRGRRPAFSVPVRRSRFPAGLTQQAWRHVGFPGRRLIAGDVDVVHGINFLAPPAAGSVATVHDTTPLKRSDLTTAPVSAKAGAIRKILRSAAIVHVPAQGIADELVADHGADPDRLAVVPHGIRPTSSTTPHPGFADYERYVITVGTTERRKRVPAIVEMMHELPDDVALVVAGPIGNDERRVSTAVRRLNDPARVIRVSAATDQARDSLIAGSVGLVLASEYEGFAFTPLEAIQLGVSVAATAVGALPELIGSEMPLVDPTEPDLASALAAAVTSTIGRAPTGAARARVGALTWGDTAAAMVEVYARAAAQAGGEPASR